MYSTDAYRQKLRQFSFNAAFKEFKQKDVSMDFDYRCQLTVSGYGCMISVFNPEEAAEICLSDSNCKAFIITDITTWTGILTNLT